MLIKRKMTELIAEDQEVKDQVTKILKVEPQSLVQQNPLKNMTSELFNLISKYQDEVKLEDNQLKDDISNLAIPMIENSHKAYSISDIKDFSSRYSYVEESQSAFSFSQPSKQPIAYQMKKFVSSAPKKVVIIWTKEEKEKKYQNFKETMNILLIKVKPLLSLHTPF